MLNTQEASRALRYKLYGKRRHNKQICSSNEISSENTLQRLNPNKCQIEFHFINTRYIITGKIELP